MTDGSPARRIEQTERSWPMFIGFGTLGLASLAAAIGGAQWASTLTAEAQMAVGLLSILLLVAGMLSIGIAVRSIPRAMSGADIEPSTTAEPPTPLEALQARYPPGGTPPPVHEMLGALERDKAAPKLIECLPDSRWGYVHYLTQLGARKPEPAVFGGLQITNRGVRASRFKARVIYSDGTDDRNWPSPWELTGDQYEELAPNESGRLLLFSIEEREGDERRIYTPFRIGLTRQGYYKFHNRFLSEKPIRSVVHLWDDHGHQWAVEIRVGINTDGTPIKEFIKECELVS